MPVNHHHRKTTREGDNGHAQKQAVIVLNRIPEPRHVAQNCRGHRTDRENAARPAHARPEQTDGSEEFPRTLHPGIQGSVPILVKMYFDSAAPVNLKKSVSIMIAAAIKEQIQVITC